jgi:hypothetical protein
MSSKLEVIKKADKKLRIGVSLTSEGQERKKHEQRLHINNTAYQCDTKYHASAVGMRDNIAPICRWWLGSLPTFCISAWHRYLPMWK